MPSQVSQRLDTCTPCDSAVALLRRFQPSILKGWTPVFVAGDGNCLFRAVSLAMFGTQELHKELRFLACLEIGENTALYDPESSACHSLLRRYDIVAPALPELIREVSSAGTSCCVAALVALSSVLQIPISSYYPPISSSFVAPLTVDIVGRGVDSKKRGIAVMWSTVGPTSGESIDINHVVPMINKPYQDSPFREQIICTSNNDNGMLL